MQKIPVLLDTDPGNDIDDALAISYLLSKPECDLLGITTVTGPVDQRSAIAEVLCHAAGKTRIPIHSGRSDVLAYGQGQPWCAQYEPIKDMPHKMNRKQDEAVDFLRHTIRSRPGEITLLSIGPFPNVALLFAIDPEIPFLLKNFVSMAGVFHMNFDTEWNCVCDPVATAMVAHSKRPKHYWVGLDVTLQCQMEKAECEKHFKGPLLELVLKMATKWFEREGKITFHDPLAAASIFDPNILAFEQGKVNANPDKGQTTFKAGEGTDFIATKVDSKRFFDEYFRVVK